MYKKSSSKIALNSGLELEFRVPIVIEIPDFLSCIPDAKAEDSRFQVPQLKFLGLHILKKHKISGIPESGYPYMGRKKQSNILDAPFHNTLPKTGVYSLLLNTTQQLSVFFIKLV